VAVLFCINDLNIYICSGLSLLLVTLFFVNLIFVPSTRKISRWAHKLNEHFALASYTFKVNVSVRKIFKGRNYY